MSRDLIVLLRGSIPLVVILAAAALAWKLLKEWFRRKERKFGRQASFSRQLIQVFMTIAVVTGVIATLPVNGEIRGQLLSFWGILISAALALSATTFLGNLLAGFMLKTIGNFSVGDFIRVDENFGRVTELGIFHVEIQTQESQLVALPNLFAASKPVHVMDSRGTLVSCSVSLGYDLHRLKVEAELVAAAHRSGLEGAFVHITSLGDFSVTYRISGFLKEVKTIVSSRSRLHANVLDALHESGMEIVSPAFMNQRVLDPRARIIPARPGESLHRDEGDPDPETVIFAKAEAAHKLETLVEGIEALRERIHTLEDEQKSSDEAVIATVSRRIQRMRAWLKVLEEKLEAKRREMES